MKTEITFDEICDARDNPGLVSFQEYHRILTGAVEMIKKLEKQNINGHFFNQLFQSVGSWSRETFPKAKPIHHLRKLKQETDEAIADPTDIYEQIDCLIALLATMHKSGFSPEMIVNAGFKKLEILKGRKWEEKPDGTHQHIETEAKQIKQ